MAPLPQEMFLDIPGMRSWSPEKWFFHGNSVRDYRLERRATGESCRTVSPAMGSWSPRRVGTCLGGCWFAVG